METHLFKAMRYPLRYAANIFLNVFFFFFLVPEKIFFLFDPGSLKLQSKTRVSGIVGWQAGKLADRLAGRMGGMARTTFAQ